MHKLLFLEGSTRFKHFVVFFGRSFYEEHCHIHFQKRLKNDFEPSIIRAISLKKHFKKGKCQCFLCGSASMNQFFSYFSSKKHVFTVLSGMKFVV